MWEGAWLRVCTVCRVREEEEQVATSTPSVHLHSNNSILGKYYDVTAVHVTVMLNYNLTKL